ncbi:MAG: bifunctional glutamate N-acetyltransferase/amino-acid acetyltransferase ArgJ [Candidatus Brocadiae bacterium]|nr:bifunctional glutamate N-acetyltransferase/amino-acid acetyltransferase ArgJ [Candidatus Brocadiia bacterium]
MEKIQNGGIVAAAGFRVGASRCGLKTAEGEPDVALIVSEGPASTAGTFTTNKFAAAAVRWNRQRLPSADIRAVVVNSGNANACTGPQGEADVGSCAELVAELVGCAPEQVCVASTGIIGHPLPMDKLKAGIRQAHAGLGADAEAGRSAERAIMTTDTRPKACAVRSEIRGMAFHVGGMAKGAGMIAPHMATMLAFVTTDAIVPVHLLHQSLRTLVDRTFNRITVDGDSSTNDTVLVLAGGASGAEVTADGAGLAEFEEALQAVLADLAIQIVRDGEGASVLIEVQVSGAADEADAAKVARAVAESQLVKCAIHGRDPNWGRIVCAAGYSGAQTVPELCSIHIGNTCVLDKGRPTGLDATGEIQGEEAVIRLSLGLGAGEATIWTCDLTEEYVRINSRYHT